jgi:hypothetical protein
MMVVDAQEERSMQTLRVSEKSGADGVLHLRVPVGQANAEFEAVIVLQPKAPAQSTATAGTPEERGWPPGYFERTFGSIDDETFERAPQGELPTPVDFD